MGVFFNLGASAEHDKSNTDTTEETLAEQIKESNALSTSNSTTSGSTNTGKTSSVNSGSVNTVNSSTSGSTNSTVNSGSVNTVQNSGQINTSQLMLSPDTVAAMTQQMLEGTNGLAAVSSGQHVAGGYNSTANTLLTNDLLARINTDVAAKAAITQNVVGASSTTQNIGGNTSLTSIGGNNTSTVQNIGSSSTDTDVMNIIGGSSSSNVTSTAALDHILGATNAVGTKDTTQTVTKADSKGGWIVCTELVRQGRMPKRFYFYGMQVFSKYPPRGKKGYYYWAVPAVNHLRAHPNSLLSHLLSAVMNPRAEYLAAEAGCKNAKKTIAGFIAKHGLYATCWILSRTLAKNYSIEASKFVPIPFTETA